MSDFFRVAQGKIWSLGSEHSGTISRLGCLKLIVYILAEPSKPVDLKKKAKTFLKKKKKRERRKPEIFWLISAIFAHHPNKGGEQ